MAFENNGLQKDALFRLIWQLALDSVIGDDPPTLRLPQRYQVSLQLQPKRNQTYQNCLQSYRY